MPTVDLTRNRLAALLAEAADAHHVYEEEELGHPDDAWAEWYAEYIMEELTGEGGDHDDELDPDVLGG